MWLIQDFSLVLGLILAFFIFQKPKLLTLVTVFFILFQLNWFVRYMGAPTVLTKVAFLFVGLLAIRILFDYLISRKIYSGNFINNVAILYLFIFIISIISCLINGEDLILGTYELRFFFINTVLLFAFYRYFRDKLNIDLFNKVIVWFALVQIPFSIMQYIAAEGGGYRTLDSVSGTFSGYPLLVGCQVTAMGLVLIDKLIHEKNTIGINGFFVSLLLLMPLLLSKSRSATILVAIIAIFSLVYTQLYKRDVTALIVRPLQLLVFSVVAGALFFSIFWKDNYDLAVQFDSSYVADYYMREGGGYQTYLDGNDTTMGRGMAFRKSILLITDSPVTSLIGYGSGATAKADAIDKEGKWFYKYGEFSGLGRSQYSKTISELGFVGLFIFVAFFTITILKIRQKFSENNRVITTYTTVIASIFFMSFYTLTIGNFYFVFVLALLFATLQKELSSKLSSELSSK